MLLTLNDSTWPSATEYTAQTVGVNFPAYTNVQSVWNNSRFIWSSNLILDNLVCLRTTVGSISDVGQENNLRGDEQSVRAMYADRTIQLTSSVTTKRALLQVISLTGNKSLINEAPSRVVFERIVVARSAPARSSSEVEKQAGHEAWNLNIPALCALSSLGNHPAH
jgi:hypothetical protein